MLRRAVQPDPSAAQLADHEQRIRQLEREVAELRGQVEAERASNQEARTALRAELQRVLDVVKGPAGAGGFESMTERWEAALAQRPESTEQYRQQMEGRRSRFDEIHGAGIPQSEMIRRIKEREVHGREERETEPAQG